jgi:hypothetical protein
MPCLWHHQTCQISFTLVVDEFGVKYVSKNNAKHLIESLKMTYTLTEDWTGDLYCGIALKRDHHTSTEQLTSPCQAI